MADKDRIRNLRTILPILFATLLVLLILGDIAYRLFGNSGLTNLDLAISGVLTVALVILYNQQTKILDSQRELLTQEMNREARSQHTEVLRERVRHWHGDTEISSLDIGDYLERKGNLPQVTGCSFKSAPSESDLHAFENGTFHAAPSYLEQDRYFQDLLENHAPDLRKIKEKLERKHDRYDNLRNKFIDEYDEIPHIELDDISLEPQREMYIWAFEIAVLRARERIEDQKEIESQVEQDFKRGESGKAPDETGLWIRRGVGERRSMAVYWADVNMESYENLRNAQNKAEEAVSKRLSEKLKKIERSDAYPIAEEAADVLDDAEKTIGELERALVEYDGRPIYTGDCEYLREASINEENFSTI